MQRIQREYVFGKASRSRVEDILRIFKQRYIVEDEVTRALVILVKRRFPASALDRILYFHSARSDRLLCDAVLDILAPLKAKGVTNVDSNDIQYTLANWVREGKTTSKWGEYTIRRVSQGLRATLRDFGVLEGAAIKRIAPTLLPVQAFAYIIFFLRQHQPSGVKLIDLPEWELFFLPPEGVERFLFEAHQSKLLEYHAAGTPWTIYEPGTLHVFEAEAFRDQTASPDVLVDDEFGRRTNVRIRHSAVWINDDTLYLFYNRKADAPERIFLSRVPMRGD